MPDTSPSNRSRKISRILSEAAVLTRLETLCSRSEQCEKALREKAGAMGMNAQQTANLLRQLQAEGYYSNARYARCFAQDKSRLSFWGPVKIRYALRNRQISEEDTENALAAIDREIWDETLRKLLVGKVKTLKFRDETEKRAKLYRFGLSRGFEYDRIRRIVAEL